MNTIPKGTYRPVQKLHPLSLLAQFTSSAAKGCLQILSNGNCWLLYLEQGKLLYASDSIDPFGRLDHHLRRLSLQAPSLVSAVRVQVRLMFETPTAEYSVPDSDYRAICWLVEQQHLTAEQAAMLIKELAKEVIESFLPIQTGNYELIEQDLLADLPKFCQLDLRALVEDCHNQLRRRQASVAPVPSPERPPAERFNLLSTNRPTAGSAQAEVTHAEPTETAPLRAAPDQAEFITAVDSASDSASDSAPLAQPAAEPAAPPSRSGVVPLPVPPQPAHQSSYASPVSPLYAANRFTQTRQSDQRAASATPQLQQVAARFRASAAPAPAVNAPTIKTYTIACIDDSQTVLQAINHFLDDKSFSVVLINDPVKALMQIIRSKPDLILLDVTMPNLDGYELCSLLRKHPSFRHTPVIMVTGNTGFIDRAKAKLVGASGYLTKPFNQSDLVKMVFKHLS